MQEAMTLLRSSLFAPRLVYLLRCMEASEHQEPLADIDSLLRAQLCGLFNIDLSERDFSKASLPLRFGGLGVRTASALAMPCRVSSLNATLECSTGLLPYRVHEAYARQVARETAALTDSWSQEEIAQLEVSSQSEFRRRLLSARRVE